MNTARLTRRFVMTSLLAMLIPIVLSTPQAYAETYVKAKQANYSSKMALPKARWKPVSMRCVAMTL